MTIKVFYKWAVAHILLFSTGCSVLDSPNTGRNDSAYQIPIEIKGSLQNPAWSPDEKMIVLTRFQHRYNEGPADLVIYDLESGNTKVIVSDGYDNVNLPGSVWNESTEQIIFSSSREPHDEIYLINVTRPGEEQKITERDELVAYEPSFSPDGQWIVFETHRLDIEDNGIITKYKIDGTEEYQALTSEHEDCRQPNWSPDGEHILYQTMMDGQWEIWIMNTDGSDKRQVTGGLGDKTDASFSPDGEWIVYSGDSPTMEFANLFIIPISGGKPTQVTSFNGYDGAPSWSPSGERIIFESSKSGDDGLQETSIWIIDLER
ncbi:MAG: PD40 domain-containing protein [Anaerolineales bacterium]|nr:PD40 domain-containing protein [Anaerolineales bacterium]